jgi:hypothetical protein
MRRLVFVVTFLAACGGGKTPPDEPRSRSVPDASAVVDASVIEATASWEVQKVEPVPGEAPPEMPAEDKAALIKKAIVREGDLKLASGAIIPGPCFNIGRHVAAEMGIAIESDADAPTFGEDLVFDIDGDGKPDVARDCGSRMWFTKYRLYVKRDDCAYYVGSVETAGVLRATKQMVKGLKQLQSDWGCGDHPGAGPQHALWAFDGHGYMRARRWTDGGGKPCNDPESY